MLFQQWRASLKRDNRSPYRRPRSQLLWFLGIDALLSIFLVVGMFQIMELRAEHSPHERELERTGAIPMSQAELIKYLKSENHSAYWLGPSAGNKYSTEDFIQHLIAITYLPSGSNLFDPHQPRLEIQTYDNEDAFRHLVHLRMSEDSAIQVQTPKGNTVIYDSHRLNSEVVVLAASPEVIVIEYPDERSRQTFIDNADLLKLIW